MVLRLKYLGGPIVGKIPIPGGKHSFSHILPVAAAASSGIINNVPDHHDARTLIALLREIFDDVDHDPAERRLSFNGPRSRDVIKLDGELLSGSRSCYGMLPALASRCGVLRLEGLPRGCVMGERPDQWYFDTLREFGVLTESSDTAFELRWQTPRPATLRFAYPTMTGTVIALAAAAHVASFGEVSLSGASVEPSCKEELALMRAMGIRVRGTLPSVIISGAAADHVEWTCWPDRVQAVALLTATMLTGGDLTVVGVSPFNIPEFVSMARDVGAVCEEVGNSVRLTCDGRDSLASTLITAGSEPLFSSDWVATTVLMLATRSEGTSVVADLVFPERMQFVDTLRPLGLTNVELVKTQSAGRKAGMAIIRGDLKQLLTGGSLLACSDLRGSGAQVLAALVAQDEISIVDDFHLRRGYEDLPGQLAHLTSLRIRHD